VQTPRLVAIGPKIAVPPDIVVHVPEPQSALVQQYLAQ
jgi:hypothetical protein